jgi:prepilin-type N-terminal cleavage/methylation domain-containing protein
MKDPATTKQDGFTLIEVVVVAVVVSVLAAIAIPTYRGYLRETELDAAQNLARTASFAADAYYRKKGADPETVDDLNLSYDADKYTVTIVDEIVRVEVEGTEIVAENAFRSADP